jgi:8-oxo-dGTP diphosphatase
MGGNRMQLLKRITDSDFTGGVPSYVDTVSRFSSRGVLIDSRLNVAMMYMSKPDLYKLPGGGIEEGENSRAAFLREIKEETGWDAEISHELGYIEEHKSRNKFMQFSYCYIAKAIRPAGSVNLSEGEKQLGMVVKWMTLGQALTVMKDSSLCNGDYSMQFMVLRDRTILEQAIPILEAGFE